MIMIIENVNELVTISGKDDSENINIFFSKQPCTVDIVTMYVQFLFLDDLCVAII